jgi:hypothetical protein
MVAYVVYFEADFTLHMREKKLVDIYTSFNDVEYMKSNMNTSWIQFKARQDSPERRDFQERGKVKRPIPPLPCKKIYLWRK